jgi:enamine deaminase RidA (YjgF/YER057c/UK114 family)
MENAMTRKALFPAGSQTTATQMKLSPGVLSGHHVFLTGMTGSRADGTMPETLEDQFRQAFDKIDAVLREAQVDCSSIVEMTSYHIGLRDHFDLFCKVRSEYVSDPFPAWTALEVAGLRREGAAVEIRVVATVERG